MPRPRLTFIHGFMGHPSDWDEVRAALPEFQATALEIRPASDWRSSVEQLADSIPADSIVVGYSMGARLALGIALEKPQRCAGLVFVSGNPGLEAVAACEQRWAADQKVAVQLEQLSADSVEGFLEQWYQADVFATVPQKIRQAEIARKRERWSPDWPAILRTHSVSRQPDYWPRLKELHMPTAVVAGELDEKYQKIAVRFEQEFCSDYFSKTIVPGCGHIVHREHPDTLVEVVRKLAGQVAGR